MNTNLAYQFEPREERIGGRVLMMAPALVNHNRAAFNISQIFGRYLRGKPWEYLPDGTGLWLSEEESYIPDGMVVCDPEKVRRTGVFGAPDLVVEVLSPSTAKHDRGHKKEVYETYGVREYWLVSPEGKSVEQYVLEEGRFVLREVYQHYSPEELSDMTPEERSRVIPEFSCSLYEDLVIRVADIFERVP